MKDIEEEAKESAVDLEERMLKNILALENNPVFTCFETVAHANADERIKEEEPTSGGVMELSAARPHSGRYFTKGSTDSGCYIDDEDYEEHLVNKREMRIGDIYSETKAP